MHAAERKPWEHQGSSGPKPLGRRVLVCTLARMRRLDLCCVSLTVFWAASRVAAASSRTTLWLNALDSIATLASTLLDRQPQRK
jgi:hypothetical protein